MSFLIRLASTREGAEKLLSADLLSKLAQCEYLGSRPQNDSSASMGKLILIFTLDVSLTSNFDQISMDLFHQLLKDIINFCFLLYSWLLEHLLLSDQMLQWLLVKYVFFIFILAC